MAIFSDDLSTPQISANVKSASLTSRLVSKDLIGY